MDAEDVDDEAIFRIAAEHFSEREFDEADLSTIWQVLEVQPMSAGDVAEQTDLSRADVAAFLDWCEDQEIVETSRRADGDIVYAHFSHQLEKFEHDAERTQDTLLSSGRRLAMIFAGLFAVAALIFIGQALFGEPTNQESAIVEMTQACLVCSLGTVGLIALMSYFGSTLFGSLKHLLGWWQDG